MAFEIGFVPRGWKRGDKLRIVPSANGRPGQVWQHIDSLPIFIEEVDPLAIACVTYRADEIPQVNTWLAWWRDKTPNGGSEGRRAVSCAASLSTEGFGLTARKEDHEI